MTDILTAIIENQEATGHRDLIYSDKLPIEGDWNILERWGVIKGAAIDKLFYSCTLPVGWEKVPTKHPMWSTLVDERGLKRASIFYKAAYYDLDAHFHIVKRFTIRNVYEDCNYDDRLHSEQCEVIDNGLDCVVFRDAACISAEVLQSNKQGKKVDVLLVIVHKGVTHILDLMTNELIPFDYTEPSLLTNKVFYDVYHNRKVTNYPHLQALERLSVVLCEDYLSQFPTDDTIWGPEYDYPDIS
jgi:hypothetical protein